MPDKKPKILLADDESYIRLLGEKFLKELGYDVVLAANGEEAIEKAILEKPDLVITDIKMPQKNGFEVCRALRNDPVLARVPILILSALGDEYNKLTGFEGGANDFLTKPFRTEELKERVALLLEREMSDNSERKTNIPVHPSPKTLPQISTGSPDLDRSLCGGFHKGSNILLVSALGKGKSTFCRRFISQGFDNREKCLFVAIDDDPKIIRQALGDSAKEQENKGSFRFIDAYSWSSGITNEDEKFSVKGTLDLAQLSSLISNAGIDIGQSVQKKEGGRRVIDSVSSLLVNFDLPAVQRFISQIGRTAVAFGGVTTLFVVEEGAVSEQVLNNIKYLMDGIMEFKDDNGTRKVRLSNMKWIKAGNEWIEL